MLDPIFEKDPRIFQGKVFVNMGTNPPSFSRQRSYIWMMAIFKLSILHLPGTDGTVFDAGKTDDALPPVRGNGVIHGYRFCETCVHALAAGNADFLIRFRGEGNRLMPSFPAAESVRGFFEEVIPFFRFA
jgi:hypothetical protein